MELTVVNVSHHCVTISSQKSGIHMHVGAEHTQQGRIVRKAAQGGPRCVLLLRVVKNPLWAKGTSDVFKDVVRGVIEWGRYWMATQSWVIGWRPNPGLLCSARCFMNAAWQWRRMVLELRVEEGAAQHLQVIGAQKAVQVVLAAGGRVGLVDGCDSDGAGLAQQQQRVAVQAVAKGGAGGAEGLGDVAAIHIAVGNVGHQPGKGSGESQGRQVHKSTAGSTFRFGVCESVQHSLARRTDAGAAGKAAR